MHKIGRSYIRREGSEESGWILLDIEGEVCCHIFNPEQREFYQLERLWKVAPRLLYVD